MAPLIAVQRCCTHAPASHLIYFRHTHNAQSQEVDRLENQVLQIRSQVVVDLENRVNRNNQKVAQLHTEMQIEVRICCGRLVYHDDVPICTAFNQKQTAHFALRLSAEG